MSLEFNNKNELHIRLDSIDKIVSILHLLLN